MEYPWTKKGRHAFEEKIRVAEKEREHLRSELANIEAESFTRWLDRVEKLIGDKFIPSKSVKIVNGWRVVEWERK